MRNSFTVYQVFNKYKNLRWLGHKKSALPAKPENALSNIYLFVISVGEKNGRKHTTIIRFTSPCCNYTSSNKHSRPETSTARFEP